MNKVLKAIIILAVCVAIYYGLKIPGCIIKSTSVEVIATVTDKERIVDEDKSYYLIYTDKETFRNEDCIWIGKTRSSDLYG